MGKIPTVKIKADTDLGFVIINEADFDGNKDALYDSEDREERLPIVDEGREERPPIVDEDEKEIFPSKLALRRKKR